MIRWVIRIAIAVVIFLLIFKFLLPLLPAPFGTVMLVVLVIVACLWLLQLAGWLGRNDL